MTESPLKYLSEKKLSELKESIVANRDRYEAGDFLDLEHDNGWAVETSTVQVDHDLLAKLDGTARTAAADIDNSLILFQALQGMTPALAREERVWARLTHIECLGYSPGKVALREQKRAARRPGPYPHVRSRTYRDPRRQCIIPSLVEHAHREHCRSG